MKERLTKLLTVKSIVTILFAMVFAYMAVTAMISGDQFTSIFNTIIAFFFGTQHEKQNKEGGSDV